MQAVEKKKEYSNKELQNSIGLFKVALKANFLEQVR